MTLARIYQPAKTAMQSGRGKTHQWILEMDNNPSRAPEHLMGWTSIDDTLSQIKLRFETQEQAIAFAEEKGLSYTLFEPQIRRVRPRNFGDNFKYAPPASEVTPKKKALSEKLSKAKPKRTKKA